MVPVLLGMADHVAGRDASESALTIDFITGLALESLNPEPKVHQLPSNSKGHYIRDIVYYLTLGFTSSSGSPNIQVLEGELQSVELQKLEFHAVDVYDMSLHDSPQEHDPQVMAQSRMNLLTLHAHLHGRRTADGSADLMCPQFDRVRSFAFDPWHKDLAKYKNGTCWSSSSR